MAKAEKATPISEGLISLTDIERLKRDMNRSDMEKFRLFTQMLRNNKLLKKAIISHK